MGRRRLDAWLPPHLVALRAEVTAAKRAMQDRRKTGCEERLLRAVEQYREALEHEIEGRRA